MIFHLMLNQFHTNLFSIRSKHCFDNFPCFTLNSMSEKFSLLLKNFDTHVCKNEIDIWERYILIACDIELLLMSIFLSTACLMNNFNSSLMRWRANMMKVDANKKLVLRWFFGEVRLRPPASRTPARATRRRDGTLRSLDRVPVPRGDVR